MTITKEAWTHIRADYDKYILPRVDGTTNEDVLNKKGIKLVVFDILAALRTTPVIFNGDDRISCIDYLFKIFDHPLWLLEHTEVKVVVVCMDAFGRRRPEKAATTQQRKRKRSDNALDTIPIPLGQSEYFIDECPMPCELDDIFDFVELKAEFYAYFTRALASERVMRRIPDGKTLIFSQGVEMETVVHERGVPRKMAKIVPPLEVTCFSSRFMHEWNNDNISEGDVDVWRWVIFAFPTYNVHVYSHDADVLIIGLLQMRRIYKDFPEREVWFVTRRSIGSEEASEEKIAYKQNMKKRRADIFSTRLVQTGNFEESARAAGGTFSPDEMGASSSSDPRPRSTVIWQDFHIDVKNMYLDILGDANDRNSLLQENMFNPVETYILILMLSSTKHDYIQTMKLHPQVGKDFVWRAFHRDIHKFDGLVRVFDDVTNEHQLELYYEIDTLILEVLVRSIYEIKGSVAVQAKHKPSLAVIRKIAAQSVWTLQYLSNGVLPNYEIIDGTSETLTGESIYGFVSGNWADQVAPGIGKNKYKISCPPILRPEKKK
jgi:hypothetical protein